MNTTATEVQVPQPAELEAIERTLDKTFDKVEQVSWTLDAIVKGGARVRFTAEEAWALTRFVSGVRVDVDQILRELNAIESNVEEVWNEHRIEGDDDA